MGQFPQMTFKGFKNIEPGVKSKEVFLLTQGGICFLLVS